MASETDSNGKNPEREVAISKLQHAIDSGLCSGPTKPLSPVLFKQKMRQSRE